MEGGIDEAGRGPVLGPLVVAGVAVPDVQVLSELGVKDSKRLSAPQRQRLARLIQDLPDVRVAVETLEPQDLDAQRATLSLNDIEVQMFRDVATRLQADRLVLDAADVDAARFGTRVGQGLRSKVVSEHKADDRHAVVAAASIIAKVERDAAIDALRRRLERSLGRELGSGYPGDAKTVAFLEAWVQEHGSLPEGTRHSWATAKRLLARMQTPSLGSFDDGP